MIKIALQEEELQQLQSLMQKEVENLHKRPKKEKIKRENNPREEKPDSQKVYVYEDFTVYHDEAFIKEVYRALLKREADADGLHHYLHLLRSGKMSKSEIISKIRYSTEGKKRAVKLLGSKKRYLATTLFTIPLIGYVSKWFFIALRLPKMLEMIRRNENTLFSVIQHMETQGERIAQQEERIAQQEKELMEKEREEEEKLRLQQLQTQKQESYFNSFYLAFENQLRGDSHTIKHRLSSYLPYIDKLNKDQFAALDLGCGRGEWLSLLREHGYNNLKGLDINAEMVESSRALGLEVVESDLLEYLQQQESNSLLLITGFHIIEHLPLNVLLELYQESFRVLKPGGMIIFETPNPENIAVGACNFYTDPTHNNPLPPIMSEFMAQHSGFDAKIVRLNLAKEAKYLEGSAFSDVNDILYAFTKEQDYAVVGYKR